MLIALDVGPRFPLGRVLITQNARLKVPQEDVLVALKRHARGDWGDPDTHDWQENQASLEQGFRLLSAYKASNGVKFWIITEADRSATVLLPEEY